MLLFSSPCMLFSWIMDTLYHPLFLFFIISLKHHFSMATDTIYPGQSLSGNQTIISKSGYFELGFFSPGNSRNYYIGIWYKKVTEQTPVWVANRERPIRDTSSQLRLTQDGNLVLISQFNILYWSSNSTSKASNSTFAVLLDTGNLVLKDALNSSNVFWESFDHPTDTWLPGGWIGYNKATGQRRRLVSWRSSEDPAPGPFSFQMNEDGTGEYIMLWNDSRQYWSSGAWNGQFFTSVPEMRPTIDSVSYTYVSNDTENYFLFTFKDNSTIGKAMMDVTGQVNYMLWSKDVQRWIMLWSRPFDNCEVYSLCGAFGICNQVSSTYCSCLKGFRPHMSQEWDMGGWSGGCMRELPLQCRANKSLEREEEEDAFLKIPDISLPANSVSLKVGTVEECKSACLNMCSCNAYVYNNGCSIWTGDLRNLQQLSTEISEDGSLYLHLAAGAISRSKKGKMSAVTVTVIVVIPTLLVFLFLLIWRHRRKLEISEELEGIGCSLEVIRYSDLQRLTNNFSEKLGGGSFGSVFKGTLPDSTGIAVKKLEGLSQGEKQFRMEVSTLGMIQHINLVRLRGFCSENTKRLLVYDYMPKGSLDCYLLPNCSEILDWKTRYEIALGTARGLAYLHEKCRDCIIHCDIKPENILLDGNYHPKVSDFGMAKLFCREFSRVMTTVRGTIGYLAPEWILGLPITAKADVYSYGMMLLEIVSGSRNIKRSEDGNKGYFPILAASKVSDGEVLGLLDYRLEGDCDMEELFRACRVACWCIQDAEDSRPSMGQVVQILEGVSEVSVPPVPRLLQRLLENQDSMILSSGSLLDQCNNEAQNNCSSSSQT